MKLEVVLVKEGPNAAFVKEFQGKFKAASISDSMVIIWIE
jgi:hypothetical protein